MAEEKYLRAQRANYYQGPEPTTTRAAWLTAAVGAGKYATRRIYFDFSHWQSDGKGKTNVDWDALGKYPQVGGAYVKLGEPGNRGEAFSLDTDLWQDDCFDQNLDGMYRNKMWIGAYTYLNCGWPLDRGYTQKGFDDIHERGNRSVEEHADKLIRDLNIYITVRRIMAGAGRSYNAAKLAGLKLRPIDKLVLDVEDVWLNGGAMIGDGWMGRTVSGCINGLKWLAEHGFLGNLKSDEIWSYSSKWVIDTYGPTYLKTALDTQPSIVAGYYWNNDTRKTTVNGLINTYLASIPNSWTPRLFGIPKMYQVAACFTIPEVAGGTSACDVNVLNMEDAEFDAINPKWVARRGAVTPPPVEPDPEPEPETPKIFTATVLGTSHNVRQAATIKAADIGDLAKGAKLQIEKVGTVDGYEWGRIIGGGYIALTGNVKVE